MYAGCEILYTKCFSLQIQYSLNLNYMDIYTYIHVQTQIFVENSLAMELVAWPTMNPNLTIDTYLCNTNDPVMYS